MKKKGEVIIQMPVTRRPIEPAILPEAQVIIIFSLSLHDTFIPYSFSPLFSCRVEPIQVQPPTFQWPVMNNNDLGETIKEACLLVVRVIQIVA